MFECALLERGDIRVLHEPMGDAFYFGPEKLSDRYSRNQCDEEYAHYKESTFKKVRLLRRCLRRSRIASTAHTTSARFFSRGSRPGRTS